MNELLDISLDAVRRERREAMLEHMKGVLEDNGKLEMEFGNGSTAKLKPVTDDDGVVLRYDIVVTLSQDDQVIEDAAAYKKAIGMMFNEANNLGKGILAALWIVWSRGLIRWMGAEDGTEFEPKEFPTWVKQTYGELATEPYLHNLINVVMNVLQPVHEADMKGEPYILNSTGERATVQMIIERVGIMAKMTDIATTFRNASNHEDREELLDAALNLKKRDAVRDVRDRVSGRQPKIKIPYLEHFDDESGRYTLTFPGLDDQQVRIIETLLKGVAEVQFTED